MLPDFSKLEARCAASLDALLADLARERPRLAILETLLDAHRRTLAQDPSQLFQLLYNELSWRGGPLARWIEDARVEFEARPGACWLRALRPPALSFAALPGWRTHGDARALSPDGAQLLVVRGSERWQVDTRTGAETPAHDAQRAVLSRDGSLAFLKTRNEVTVQRVADGARLAARSFTSEVRRLLPCAGGLLVHAGYAWHLWDYTHDQLLGEPIATACEEWHAINPTGDRLVVYGRGWQLEGWALPEIQLLFQDQCDGSPLGFHPGGKYFATSDGRCRDATTGEVIGRLPVKGASSLSFDPTGRYFLSSHDERVDLWDLQTSTVVARSRCARHGDLRVHWSRDGRVLTLGDWDSSLITDLTALVPMVRSPGDEHPVRADWSTRFSPSGATLIVEHRGGIGFWDVARGVLRRFVEVDDLLTFFDSGRRVIGRQGDTLIALATEDGAELWRITLPGDLHDDLHAADANGVLLYGHRAEKTVIALGMNDGRELYRISRATLVLHDRDVFLTRNAAKDVTLRAVDTGAELLTLPALGGDGYALSSDRRWLAVSNHSVAVWDLTTRTRRHTFAWSSSTGSFHFTDSTTLTMMWSQTQQSGNQDWNGEQSFDLATGASLGTTGWWDNDAPSAPPDPLTAGVRLPYKAIVCKAQTGAVHVATTASGRVELFELRRAGFETIDRCAAP